MASIPYESWASGAGDAGVQEPRYGLEAFTDELLNRSGGRRINGRSSRGGARYTGGPARGLTQSEAMQKARDIYGRMSDGARKAWEAKAGFEDVRSSREKAAAGGGYAGPELTETQKTRRWHSGDGKMKQGFDSASPRYKSQLIGMYGSEEAARAQFGEKPDGKGGFLGPSGQPVGVKPAAKATAAPKKNPSDISLGIGTTAKQASDFSGGATAPAVPGATEDFSRTLASGANAFAKTDMTLANTAEKPGGAFSMDSAGVGMTLANTAPEPGSVVSKPTTAPRVGMIDGKPAGQAIADATKAADTALGVPGTATGTVGDDGGFRAPEGGGELVGISGGKPLYEQKAASYAGPDGQPKPMTQASAATAGAKTPGDAVKKAKRMGVGT